MSRYEIAFSGQLVPGARLELVQADAASLPFELMKHKEAQMVSIGARLVQRGGQAETAEAARLNASASFPFTAGLDTLSQDSPLRWQLDASLPDLQVLRPWLPSGLYLDAALQTSLRGSGSLRQPDAEGHLDLQAIRFRYPQEGIVITDGDTSVHEALAQFSMNLLSTSNEGENCALLSGLAFHLLSVDECFHQTCCPLFCIRRYHLYYR